MQFNMHDREDLHRFLNSMSPALKVIEEGGNVEVQQAYMSYSSSFGYGELSDKEAEKLNQTLLSGDTNVCDKKKALTILAHSGTVAAFRYIESFYNHAGPELKEWAFLALQECRVFLESNLTGESGGLILTGLGGSGQKLRYWCMVLAEEGCLFDENCQEIFNCTLGQAVTEKDGDLEYLGFYSGYICFSVLISGEISPGPFIEGIIDECNEALPVELEHVYVTNARIPDEKEIEWIIRKIREDD